MTKTRPAGYWRERERSPERIAYHRERAAINKARARRKARRRRVERAQTARTIGKPRSFYMGWCPICSRSFVTSQPQKRTCRREHLATLLARENRARRQAIIAKHKTSSGCKNCGKTGPPEQLHLHHRSPATKLFTIADNYESRTWTVVLAEIAKCDVLCKTCHEAHHRTCP